MDRNHRNWTDYVYNHFTLICAIMIISVFCHYRFVVQGIYMGSGTGGDAGAQYSIFQRFLAEIIENKKGFWSFNLFESNSPPLAA